MKLKEIIIIGAGGMGRDVQWLIERINEMSPTWKIEGYLDDNIEAGTIINGYKVLGGIHKLAELSGKVAVVCAIGSAHTRKKIIENIKTMGDFEFPNLIDPSAQMSHTISMGMGNIICAGNILTVNITIGDFTIVNVACTIGHDVVMNSYVTLYPGVNVSGCIHIQQGVELGTGSKIIQGKTIGENAIVGAGAVVVNDIKAEHIAVGCPAREIKHV